MIVQLLKTGTDKITSVEVPDEPTKNTVLILPPSAYLAGFPIDGLILTDETIAIFIIRNLTYATGIHGYIGPLFSYREISIEEYQKYLATIMEVHQSDENRGM